MTSALTPIASALTKQPIGADDIFAAPCFEFYPPTTGKPLSSAQLFAKLKEELKAAYDLAVEAQPQQPETVAAIEKARFAVDGLVPDVNGRA